MYKKLEGTIMKSLGNSLQSLLISMFAILFFNLYSTESFCQLYYINSYMPPSDNSGGFYAAHTYVIDLDRKSVIDSVIISESGSILDKLPILILRNDREFLISFTLDGAFAKNSAAGLERYLIHYSINQRQNNRFTLIRSDDIRGAKIELLEQTPGVNGFRFAASIDTSTEYMYPPGLYTLGARDNLQIERQVPINEIPGSLGNISGFSLLKKVWGADNYRLYHSFHNSQYWLAKLNEEQNAVIDSVQLRQSGGQATIYAYHSVRNKFYCFHLNYEMHGEYTVKNREDYYTNPEVLIYDPASLQLMGQLPVSDYPDGNYPGRENGLADVVGDYIVYYFFKDDWMEIFAPAMLFIFDTRTNEATWLRVGWR